MIEREFYGNDAQRTMQARAVMLWTLLRDDPRYCYNGRAVGEDGLTPEGVDRVAALARLQGGTISCFVKAAEEPVILEGLKDRGFDTDRWDQFMGGAEAIAACRALVAEKALPAGFSLAELTARTPKKTREDFAAVALSCGVLPPAPASLVGITRPGYAAMALDDEGRVAAVAGSIIQDHAESPYGDAAWWGMLATREDCRGFGLARLLGAHVAATMAERHGVKRFFSGVRAGNEVARRLCRSLSIENSRYVSIAALDPSFGAITK